MKIFAIQRDIYSSTATDEGDYIHEYAGTAVDHAHLYLTRESAEAALADLTAKPEPQPEPALSVGHEAGYRRGPGAPICGKCGVSLDGQEDTVCPADMEESSYDDDGYSPNYTIVELEVKS